MIVLSDYRGHRIEVTAVPVDGRFNAEVRLRRHFPVESKAHVEVVSCLKMSAALAEQAGERWAKRWIDVVNAAEAPPRERGSHDMRNV